MIGRSILAIVALVTLGANYFSTSEFKNYEGEF